MRNNNNLLKSEEGQILVYVLIAALVAVLVVPPLIGLTYSGYHSASISKDKMVQFYAADTGIEEAIYQLMNRGNDTGPDHNWKVPEGGDTTTVSWYWIGDDDPDNKGMDKAVINGCNVRLDLTREGNDTYTYTILSTSTEVYDGPEIEASKTKAIIKAKVIVGEGNHTLYGEEPGPAGISPFSYAIACLGPDPITLEGSGGANPTIISGDIYSSGDMIIEPNVKIIANNGKPSSVWANGMLTMGTNSYVSGGAHSSGNMTLDSGARIDFNAYSGGSITLAGPSSSAARIAKSSYAIGDITLYNSSTIGNSTESGGNINVHGKNPPAAEIFGNSSANQNIVGDGQKDASAIIDGDATAGGSISPETSKWIINGTSDPNTLPTPPAPSLPPMIELTNPSIDYWQSFYKQEAHGANPVPDPYEVPLPDLHPVDGPPVNYESGTIYLKPAVSADISLGPLHVTADDPSEDAIYLFNKVTLYLLDTVYVDGSVYIDNNCQIVGGGKLVATGDVTIYNSAVGMGDATTLPLIMSINGDILTKNCGNLSAVLYAPSGTVDIGANDVVFGSVVAQSITNKNNIVLTYDERVTSIPGLPGGWEAGNGTEETSWQEPWPGPGAYIVWYSVVK